MAKRRPPHNGVAPIRFGELDGSQEDDPMKDDDEMVDPLDVGRDAELPNEDADPRTDDPFADDELDDVKIEDVSDEEEPEADDEPEEEKDDPKALRAQLEAERQQRLAIEREREEARRELEEARKAVVEARTKRIDDELGVARAALKAAIEEGDTDKQVELQDKLAELRAEKLVAGQQQPQRPAPPADDMPHIQAHTPAAQEWLKGKTWINDRSHKQANQDLLKMAGTLADEGYDANLPDFFNELERRLERRHPTLFPKKEAPKRPVPGKQAVARVSRDNPPAEPRQGKTIKLTSADLATMRRFNLDPNNKEHLREFARGKVS